MNNKDLNESSCCPGCGAEASNPNGKTYCCPNCPSSCRIVAWGEENSELVGFNGGDA